MSDLLEQGVTWLADQRQNHLAKTVTYTRGADSVQLQATVGRTVFHLEDALGGSGGGGVIRVVSRDYLVRAQDLVLAGQATLPQRGDVIRETAGTVTHVHEVVAPGGTSGGEWRHSDPQRTTIRIHTKEVDQEVV